MKRLILLGATGSIGRSTLDLVDAAPSRFSVVGLSVGSRIGALPDLITRYRPQFVAVADPEAARRARTLLEGSGVTLLEGGEGLIELARQECDIVVAGIVGVAGLPPVLAAVQEGRAIAFANKECLVSAGALMMREVARHGAMLLPVDSEHNALFQVFETRNRDAIEQIVLTASGGPFRNADPAEMASATPEDAVAHPVWSMGAKISVDSATMMNKALEVIEAHFLFDMPAEKIGILIHPQSIVHSMVVYADGSVLAQMGSPDMRTPLSVALAWPERMAAPVARLDLVQVASLSFEAPDEGRFPALRLAREALASGGAAPTLLNAANEEAVAAFLDRRIGFLEIAAIVEQVLFRALAETQTGHMPDTLEAVLHLDSLARRHARDLIGSNAGRPAMAGSPSS